MTIRIQPDDIGETIYGLRSMLRLTQTEFADEIGAYASQISAWESGQRKPDLASVAKLARAFGYDLALVPREDA